MGEHSLGFDEMINSKIGLSAEMRFGFNRTFWDCRDRDGSELANGVYLYKVILRTGGKTEEAIQKLAKVR